MTFKEGCEVCAYNYEYGWLEALRAALMDIVTSPEIETALKVINRRIKAQDRIVERGA